VSSSTLVCDFCHASDPTWDYPAHDFFYPSVPGLPRERSTGSWLACDVCHVLIEAARWRDLARRSAALFMQRNGLPTAERSELVTHAVTAHRLFREHRNGPATPRGRV
jgi:hypothetical protein